MNDFEYKRSLNMRLDHPILDAQQERELFEDGSQECLELIFEHNQKLAHDLALKIEKEIGAGRIPFEDLSQNCFMILWDCIRKA